MPAASAAAGPISEVTAQALEASSISTSRPTLYIWRCRATASVASGSVSSQISPVLSRRTRMSACMWPLRSKQRRVTALVRSKASRSLVSWP